MTETRMTDLHGCRDVAVKLSLGPDGTQELWVNVEGACRLRIKGVTAIRIEDQRDHRDQQTTKRPPLFQWCRFTSHSGAELSWKIECDALTPDDWDGAARIAASKLPPFSEVMGVPRGGDPFAAALAPFASGRKTDPVVIADDVCTTGRSLQEHRDRVMADRSNVAIGLVLASRGSCPSWALPMLEVAPWLRDREPKRRTQ